MERATIVLKPREDMRIRAGHPWIYDNEIAQLHGNPGPGAEIEVLDSRRQSLGCAFWNPASKIRARMYSRIPRSADNSFFAETIGKALAWRKRFFDPETQSLRLVFGEADGLPGLIVDSFVGYPSYASMSEPGQERSAASGRWLSAQFLSLGVDARKQDIIRALSEVFPHDGIMERSDAPVRAFEGLEPTSGLLSGEVPSSILIEENGASFRVDLLGGQKTGWFLDQRANRAAASAYADGRRVLDVFCNAGGFGIVCARKGASQVIAVDSSSDAISSVRDNAALNGVSEKITAVEANAFDYLRELEHKKDRYGLIILDPPAFAKNRASVESAYRGYKDINLRALRLLDQGGILVTNSCSHWFGRERFEAMLEEAARDAGRRLRFIEERGQDLDHPVVSGYGESRYLKCFIVEA